MYGIHSFPKEQPGMIVPLFMVRVSQSMAFDTLSNHTFSGEYTELPTQNSAFPENGIREIPGYGKSRHSDGFFHDFHMFFGLQASKHAVT